MRLIQKIVFLVFFFLFAKPLLVGAFGVSPPFINADKLVKGVEYETTIILSQGQPKEDLKVKAVFDVPEKVRSWFSVDKGEEFIIPAGTQQFPISVFIKVPENTDLGIYKGYLRINTVPAEKEGQVSIAVGARVDINMTVGEGAFIDFNIKRIEILDIKEGQKPKIRVELENKGNVAVAPELVTFDVLDKYGSVKLATGQNNKLPETPPFKTKKFIVEIPIGMNLGIGEYWAEAKIYYNGQIVKNGEIKTVFDVTERKFNILWIIIGVGGLIVLALSAFFLKKKIKKPIKNVTWEFYRDSKKLWRWHQIASNGRIVMASTEGFKSRAACEENAQEYGWRA